MNMAEFLTRLDAQMAEQQRQDAKRGDRRKVAMPVQVERRAAGRDRRAQQRAGAA